MAIVEFVACNIQGFVQLGNLPNCPSRIEVKFITRSLS